MFLHVAVLLAGTPALPGTPTSLFAQTGAAMPANRGFATVRDLQESCSACHDWTGSYESIMGGGKIIAGSPEKSPLYQKIATDQMPMEGEKLAADQKAFIKGWIAAGAPSTELPIAVPAVQGAAVSAEAGAPPTAPAPAASSSFLGFPNKTTFHAVTGFTSSVLFLGAGVMGVWHFLNMMSAGHQLRDTNGWTEGSPESVRAGFVEQAWAGISMMTHRQPAKVSKHDIHRRAFFTHAALMVAQVGLGFAESYALSTGQHDLMIGLGATHAVIGLAIPAVMIGAGLENLFLPE